jgi:hypothetical protein
MTLDAEMLDRYIAVGCAFLSYLLSDGCFIMDRAASLTSSV